MPLLHAKIGATEAEACFSNQDGTGSSKQCLKGALTSNLAASSSSPFWILTAAWMKLNDNWRSAVQNQLRGMYVSDLRREVISYVEYTTTRQENVNRKGNNLTDP